MSNFVVNGPKFTRDFEISLKQSIRRQANKLWNYFLCNTTNKEIKY